MRVICMDRKNVFIFSGEIFFTKILSNIEAGDSIRFAWCETNNEVITLSDAVMDGIVGALNIETNTTDDGDKTNFEDSDEDYLIYIK